MLSKTPPHLYILMALVGIGQFDHHYDQHNER